MTSIEWVDSESEWFETDGYRAPAFYVVDSNGIVAGPFDDEGEAMWWEDKAVRVA
jgi:hypothetical protein